MKKILSLFIALIYLATSSGMALQVHYCMDKVTGLSLVASEKEACDKCGMKKAANPCCKDELTFVKLQDAHKLLTADLLVFAPVALPVHQNQGLENIVYQQPTTTAFVTASPPGRESSTLHILYCVFRV